MNCFDIQKSLHVFIDGEYAETERHEVETHLDACPQCRRRVDRESTFIGAVRAHAPVESMPPSAAQRLFAVIAAEPAPAPVIVAQRSWWGRGLISPRGLALAATVIVGVGFGLVAARGGADDTERIATEAIASHTRSSPMEVRGSSRQVLAYLAANVPFEVELPFDGQADVRLVGARLTRVDGRDAVLLHYLAGREPLTVVQVASRDAGTPPAATTEEPRVYSENGFDAVTYRRRGVVSSFVGSGRDGRLPALVRVAWRP